MTRSVDIGPAAVNIAAGLSAGRHYTIEAVLGSSGDVLFMVEQAAAPSATNRARRLRDGDTRPIQPAAGIGIWVWSPAGKTDGIIMIDESPE